VTTHIVLLPGMDGTGELFAPFVAAAPPAFTTQVVAFPPDEALGYAELADRVRPSLPQEAPWMLLGESFSGPLALQLAAEEPPGLVGVVLCATFLRAPPGARFLSVMGSVAGRVEPPEAVVGAALTGGDRALAADVLRAMSSTTAEVRQRRFLAIAEVDAADALRSLSVPVLALVATEDRVVGRRALRRIRDARPDTVVAKLPGPHLVLQSRPDDAWAAIARFARSD
jgi:pimeloyl-ACP methyl ester carboxylesterase